MANVDRVNKDCFNRQCVICKKIIPLYRNKSNDALLFEHSVYHIKCFEESNVIKRKCFFCNKDIIISSENSIDNVVYYDKHYSHKDCLLEKCNQTKTKKWKFALEHIEEYIEDAKTQLLNIFSKKINSTNNILELKNNLNNYINKYFTESDVNTFIKEHYDLTTIDYRIWNKISSIYNGTFKGLEQGIPATDLLDMWNRKIVWLNKISNQNVTKGKEMDAEHRVLYDLSVLVNKYDSYLKWKEQQKILESEENSVHTQILQNIDLTVMSKQTNKNNKESNSDDIDDLLNELFN